MHTMNRLAAAIVLAFSSVTVPALAVLVGKYNWWPSRAKRNPAPALS